MFTSFTFISLLLWYTVADVHPPERTLLLVGVEDAFGTYVLYFAF